LKDVRFVHYVAESFNPLIIFLKMKEEQKTWINYVLNLVVISILFVLVMIFVESWFKYIILIILAVSFV